MKVRITRPLHGSIDGIRLDGYLVGEVYEVGTTLGCYLLAISAATPAADDTPVKPLSQLSRQQPDALSRRGFVGGRVRDRDEG
jgi:hypothetical protein